MKKILFVMQSLQCGGAEKSLVNLLHELPKDKYQIDIMLFRKEGLFLQHLPPHVRVIDAPEGMRRLYSPLRKCGKYLPIKLIGTAISRLVEKGPRMREGFRWKYFYKNQVEMLPGEYDVALAYISGEVLYFVGDKVCAKRKLVWVHSDYRSAGHPKKYDYPYLTNMNGIVSISDACVDILKDEFPEFKDKIKMLENITSSTLVKERAQEPIEEDLSGEEATIVSVGRLSEVKGFDMAIDAAALMKEAGYKFKWYILGEGNLRESLQQQIVEKQVDDSVFLLGIKENPYPYMKQCTIVAQTSRWEGKSVVLDEAKILAKPIVVTDYDTVKDQISNEEEGIIVPMTPKGIAEGLEKLISDAALRKKMECYLSSREYGNQAEAMKYMDLIDAS